jgi:hypothetical protein
MSQETVLGELRQECSLAPVPGTGNTRWTVFREVESGKVGSYCSVHFGQGKLQQVRKSWTPLDNEKGAATVERLIMVLAEFEREGAQECTIRTRQHHQARVTTVSGQIVCGRRAVEVRVDAGHIPEETSPLRELVSVDEVVK